MCLRSCCSRELCRFMRVACTFIFVFFFSSRRRHTRCSRDWSSDVCSSDLFRVRASASRTPSLLVGVPLLVVGGGDVPVAVMRSEERRVGKECRSRWSPYH